MKKKAQLLISFTAAVVGVAMALAFRQQQGCLGLPQYFYNGSTYVYAGTLGNNYMCTSGGGVCTYYLIGSTYEPCERGVFVPFNATKRK